MLNGSGGFESDLTALRLSDDCYRLQTGSAAIKRDRAWLQRHLRDDERVIIADETDGYAILALMGPDSLRIATELGGAAIATIGYFRHRAAEIAGLPVRAARLSYVGEPGWELTCRVTDAVALHDSLTEAGAKPAGLYAQTSMRVEKRYLAFGHDLDGDVSPLEAGLGFAVDSRTGFIGRDALLRRRSDGISRRMATLILEDRAAVPLGDEPVHCDGRIVGQATSASFGYRIGRPLALGYVDAGIAEKATVALDIAGTLFRAQVLHAAAFDPHGTRLRKAMNPAT